MFGSLRFFVCLSQIVVSLQADDTYKALVVEYYPVQGGDLTPVKRAEQNVEAYKKLVNANTEDVDVIVFPESTITTGSSSSRKSLEATSTLVPLKTTPCDSDDFPTFFKDLSCVAKDKASYVVVNLVEKAVCSEEIEKGESCASDDLNFYNTNVAFDRNGVILARYRKYNLFGEHSLNKTKEAESIIFETDFGVSFGMFTCFDILFEDPALKLVRKGVKHIIFPTMWFSELPFLTALQTQSMWSMENDVVVLSAGANNPKLGSGGTGIFQGKRGALTMDIVAESGSRVYVQDVSQTWDDTSAMVARSNEEIDEFGAQMDSFYLKLDKILSYNSSLLDLSAETTDEKLCYDDFCCDFHVSTSSVVKNSESYHYQYRMVAFSGVRSFDGVYNGGIDVCALVFCQNSKMESCGKRHETYTEITWPYTFDEVTISGTFDATDNTTQLPNTLLSDIKPMPIDHFSWESAKSEDDGTVTRKLSLREPQDRLMVFGIYGRDFGRDSAPSGNSGNSLRVTVAALMAAFVKLFL